MRFLHEGKHTRPDRRMSLAKPLAQLSAEAQIDGFAKEASS
jgi:hypothetical protein